MNASTPLINRAVTRPHRAIPSWLALVLAATLLSWGVFQLEDAAAWGSSSGYSLRFHGNGYLAPGKDRVKIRVDDPSTTSPGPPVDIGSTDFTIEFWMKAHSGENTSPPQTCGANVNWIYGNIVLDRDRYNQDRKYGISIAGGKVVFGVSGDGTGDMTICGSTSVVDDNWHHVAVARRRSDGWMWLFVDGAIDAQGDGPDGDVSYPDDGVPGNYCGGPCVDSDPFIVIGAEKHDAGPTYPSYSGWIDEVRFSTVLRYTASGTPPAAPFVTDAYTAALYHLDEGAGNVVHDTSGASGGPSDGTREYGGSPAGPEWSSATPFSGQSCMVRPPAPASRQYFAEGATKDFFDTWILLANPATTTAEACLTFLEAGATRPGPKVSVPPGGRRSVKVDDYVDTFEVATVVEGVNQKVYAERAMYSSKPSMQGAHLAKGSEAPSNEWFMAEGATAGDFETWILLANPDPAAAASVSVTLLTDSGPMALPAMTVDPLRRKSIRADDYVNSFDVSAHIVSSGAAIVAERATYSAQAGRAGATASPAIPAASNTHFLAEGATAGPFETWVLVANPSQSSGASVTLEFMSDVGVAASVSKPVPAGHRVTMRADDYVDSYNVSTKVTSTGAPVIAERAMYKNTFGGLGAASGEPTGAPAPSWLAVEGASEGGFETWVLVANPDPTAAATVKVTYLTANGAVTGPLDVIPPKSRRSYKVNSWVRTFDVSSKVDVVSGAWVVVERTVYAPAYLTGDSSAGPALPFP